MDDSKKPKPQLLEEIQVLRDRLAELERAENGQKRAEEALRESERRFRELFDGAPLAYHEIDTDGRITRVNQTELDMLGHTAEEMLGRFIWEFVQEQDTARKAVIAKLAGTMPPGRAFERTYLRKDATLIPVLIEDKPLRDKSGKITGLRSTMQDITQRKHAEEALRFEREQLFSIFDSINQIVYVSDPVTYEVLYVNKALLDIFRKNSVGGLCYKEFQGLESPCPFCTNDIILKRKYEPYQWEHHNPTVNRDFMLVDRIIRWPDGRDVRFELAIDITDRKQAEQRLERRERLYREAIEVAGAVPYYQDYATETYEFVGEGIEKLSGYKAEEFTRETWISMEEDFVLLGDLEGMPLDDAVRKARGIEGVSWQANYRIKTRGGEERWLANAAVQVRDEQGNVVGSLGILRDITESKRLEEQLRQSQKMEAVGQLAGGVAHDFNNLLTGIIGNLSLAQIKAGENVQGYITQAERAAERAANLVQQLLAFSRKSQLTFNAVDLNQIVEEVFHIARETIDRRTEIVTHLDTNIPRVRADAAQISSVLMNLCVNARDAIGEVMCGQVAPHRRAEQFTVTIETETTFVGEAYCNVYSYARPGQYVILSVSDNGAGMDTETKSRIFEPFFTTKEIGRGTGLGLATAYGIVKQHDGWINVYSESGKGTTFKIYLPAEEEAAPRAEKKQEEEVRGGTETVLLVDDEEMIRSLGESILQDLGYTALLAADGREALDLYRRERERIDLIILDLSMPHLSGREVLEQIHAMDPDAKVIISSGYSRKSLTEPFEEIGAAAYVAKPYRFADLARTVREVLDR
ncbi:MAG: PAS domain S-box protein [bacterium]